MKKLYARLVLWLIRPALELREGDGRVVITQVIRAAQDAVTQEFGKLLSRRG